MSQVGGDARWLVAAGRGAAGTLPYSTYADATWPPVPRFAEWFFTGLYHALGSSGLQLAHVMAVVLTVSIAAVDMSRSGLSDRRTAGLLLVLLGASSSFLIIRLQLFSLPLFAGLLLLLRAETRRPSARIWLLLPLLALWSNLHGGALVGAAVAGAYLLVHRLRTDPVQSGLLIVSSLAALCLTPALLDTPRYYAGVLGNELAREHVGLWAPLDPRSSPFDLALLLCAAVLLPVSLRSRPPLWEAVALLGLSILTVESARGGVWLLLLAVGAGRTSAPRPGAVIPRWVAAVGLLAASGTIVAAVVRGPLLTGADRDLLLQAVSASEGSPVAAEGALGEQVALAGGCLWVTNPLDAFPRPVQRDYVHWSESGDPALLPGLTRVAVVRRHSRAAQRLTSDPAFRLVTSRDDVELFVRDVHGGTPCVQWKAVS